ncbi:MAG: MBL fold metallo-hydrolase [Cyclobacteriaceae bacterium]|nr:MBL fold metallo-hydrolase [Cyclobacteriaceae bacterium]MDH4298552.1 MBL fold metallo-hydrolase [Cyclobacteriaceae bacterium]MDH5251610.1 MBL fold metallo-hydrolase [Cyclobacteriaceae bacterium]
MRKNSILFLFCLVAIPNLAQRPAPDQMQTSIGPLVIQPILHGTVALTWNGKTIYVDPYGGAKAFEGVAAPDLVLITDIHGDHLNAETLAAIETTNAVFVVPQAVADQLPENLKPKAVVLNNTKSTRQLGISITAIPMYNLPEDADSRHTKGRGNGYTLDLGGKLVYFSGDTEDIPEMRKLKNIDVAFVCMNLPYTMDINQAASAVLEFKPKIVYPYHYRGQNGLNDVDGFKKLVNAVNPSIDVRLRDWYISY